LERKEVRVSREYKLNKRNATPPGGWKYKQKETGLWIDDNTSLEKLAVKVSAHRKYKEIEPSDLESVTSDIETQICMRLDGDGCVGEGDVYKDQGFNLKLSNIESASKSLLKFMEMGGEFADPNEAGIRAEICRGCPFNRPAKSCLCNKFMKVVNDLVLKKGSPREGLDICGICGCSLQAKTNVPMEVVKKSNEGKNFKYPEWCWQK